LTWYTYQNGNYTVHINTEDGTKIKETDAEEFKAAFPESIDCKITDYCEMNCPWCHENSSLDGKHANIAGAVFIETLRPFTEIAIGGGNPLAHPNLVPFLEILQEKQVIANITVNQNHFINKLPFIEELVAKKLIYGLGISLVTPGEAFIGAVQKFPNAVIHVINGATKVDDIWELRNKGLKLLILGYKKFRRGVEHYSESIEQEQHRLWKLLPAIMTSFKACSFDNLALTQLKVKDLLSEVMWDAFYQGDDGSHTLYVDLVRREFALNSTSKIVYSLRDSIDEMFQVIQNPEVIEKDG